MMHFFYGIPRLVFLTAPLSFLFFGAHVIHASATMLALYALPHVVHATLTNSRMQSRFRHSFWAEVYEAVLASYIALPTLLALVNPRLGKFNVTAKGGRIDRDYFDWAISKPYLSLVILNAFGLAMGALHIALNRGVGSEVQTTAFNLAWTTYNLLILGLAVAAANERRQVRESHRVAARIPVMLRFGNGRTLACETLDYSEGGIGVALPEDARVPDGEQVTVSLFRGVDECAFPGTIEYAGPGRLGIRFETLSQQWNSIWSARRSRADAWIDWTAGRRPDSPPHAFLHLATVGIRGLLRVIARLYGDLRGGHHGGRGGKGDAADTITKK
jgi:cellulose synthase (UDP-forming)